MTGLFMRYFFGALLLIIGLPHVVHSDELRAEFRAYIDANDLRNSRGQPLTELGAVLQQNRANLHRFNLGHELDTASLAFYSAENRARIPNLYNSGPRVSLLDDLIKQGISLGLVNVYLCRTSSGSDYITVAHVFEDGTADGVLLGRGC